MWSRVLKPEWVAWHPPIPVDLEDEEADAREDAEPSWEQVYRQGLLDGEARARQLLEAEFQERLRALEAEHTANEERLAAELRAVEERRLVETAALALAIAERILEVAFRNPERLQQRILAVLQRHRPRRFVTCHVAPEVVPGVEAALASESLEVRADPSLDAGSFYLAGEGLQLDGTLQTALSEVADALWDALGEAP